MFEEKIIRKFILEKLKSLNLKNANDKTLKFGTMFEHFQDPKPILVRMQNQFKLN